MRKAEVRQQLDGETRQQFGDAVRYRTKVLMDANAIWIGGIMEQIVEEMRLVNEEARESKQILQTIFNEISALRGLVKPLIKEGVTEIRTARMNVVTETQSMLAELKDIRKFFLESDYKEEMGRLREFVSLCREIKKLKEDGTLDAIGDTILNLAVKTK